jgi:diaminopimelate epimerase
MITLTKHHGLGNDFLVALDPRVALTSDHARRWCDRRRGVGADGLLVCRTSRGIHGTGFGPSEFDVDGLDDGDGVAIDATMLLFNADGSTAEMSGNGIRCLVQALDRSRRAGDVAMAPASNHAWLLSRPITYRIATDAGLRVVHVRPTEDPLAIMASVSMGSAVELTAPENWDEVGCDPMRPVAHLSLGNPHSVVAVDDVLAVDLAAIGSAVPQVNLEIVQSGPERHAITMRVHERGAGITEACGTGASAAAYAALRWGLVDAGTTEVLVHMDGGDATVAVGEELILTGPAVFIGTVEVQS